MGICVAVGIKYHSYMNHRLNANNLEQNGPHCSTIPFTLHSNIHTGKQRESQTGRNWEERNWPGKQGGWAPSPPWGRRGCGLRYRRASAPLIRFHFLARYKTAVFVLLWSSLREKGKLSSQHMAVMRWNYSGRNEIGRLSELKPEAQWWSLSLGLSWSPRTAGPSEGSLGDSARRHWWPRVSPTFEKSQKKAQPGRPCTQMVPPGVHVCDSTLEQDTVLSSLCHFVPTLFTQSFLPSFIQFVLI